MKIQTVNQLISVFKDISTRHYQINGFGIGDNWENGASESKMHPVLWINPTTATMPSTDNGYKTFEIDFEVRVFDLVNKDESNENEVLSDCIDILKDIITEFKGHPYYVNSQLNIIDDISFEAFTEEFDEEVSGWVCEISLMTPILTSFCGIPSADITGFEFPGIDCPDVNVLCPVFVEDVTGVYPIVVNTIGTTKEISLVGGASDTFVISGEYDNGTLTLTRNDSVDVVVTGFENDYTTAATLSGNIITFDRTDTAAAYSVDLTSAINSAPDKFVQSGAYDEPNKKIVLTLNDASTVDIDTSAISGGGGGGGIDNVTTAEKSALSPSIGEFVYDTDLSSLQRYDGSNWISVANGYGFLSLTSSIGEPTFYTTYTLAIAAASTGDTITQYGNINDSSNTTVILNKAVNINLNGFTYTNSSAGNSDSFNVTTNEKVKILNGVIERIGGTYNLFQSRAFVASSNTDIELTGTTVTANNGIVLSSSGSGIKILNGLFVSTGLTGSQFSVLSTAQIIAASFESTGINKFQGILYNVKATSTIGYNQLQGATSEARFCEFRVTDSLGGSGLLIDQGKVFYCDCFTAATNTLYAGLSLGGADSEVWYSLGYADNTHGIKVGSSVPKGIYNCTGININGNRYGVLLGDITEVLDSTFISINGAGAASCNGSDILIDSCNFKTESGSSYKRGFFDNGTSGNVRLYNCLIETAGSGAGNDSAKFSNGRTVYLANNRIKGGTGITNPNGNSQTTTPDSVGNIILN